MNNPTVFISYSHDSDSHRDRVLALSERLRKDGIATRLDQYLNGAPTEGWPRWMRQQLSEADFVLVICTETYYRRFWGDEEPGKGKGADWEGALITQEVYDARSATLKFVPVIFAPDQQDFIPESLRSKNHYALTSEANYQALYDFLLGQAGVEPGAVGALKRKPRAKAQPLTFADDPQPNPQSAIPTPQSIEIARLPSLLTRDLFGRDDELQLLDDAWANPATNIVVFAAFGGTGKSALVNNWVRRSAQENYRGAARVYAWSFWSQGADQPQTSADPFIDAALRWCGDADPAAGSPWDKGERLARLIKQTRTLLILDGLEPLQHPPGPMEGQLKEQTMQALLRELAAGQPGLCVISTREPLADLLDYAAPAVVSCDLEQLSPQAGAQILRQQEIAGDEAELEQASADFGNHALALTILGSLLKDAYGGDLRRRQEIPALRHEDDRKGRHALRVMASYEKWLSAAGEEAMLAVLRLLGLFNRPAEAEAIAALRAAPAIPGLTDALQNLSEWQWQQTLAKLRRIKLLAARVVTDFGLSPAPGQTKVRPTEELDAHALVREHFGQQLRERLPDAWQAAHNRLYEHLTRTAKEFPGTVEEMAPLFAAIAHGCAAGRHQEALDDVYLQRIQRGEEFFNTKKLGALGAELAALAGFFAAPWHEPQAGLTEAYQAFVLNEAGFDLRALGRLKEAAQPLRASLEMCISQEDWKNAAIRAGNLSELYLTLGAVAQARELAQQSVELADGSGDISQPVWLRAHLADRLHQAGKMAEAETVFREAEILLKERHSTFQFLIGVPGFLYCDLLLGQGRLREVRDRATQTLEWAKEHGGLLDIALDNLSLGRASLRLATGAGERAEAAEFLQRAVNGLRQAGMVDHLPRGLLARAELYRLLGDRRHLERAQLDLAEAQRLAARGAMDLHLADCHLEWARLALAQGDPPLARAHWATAKAMIERMGYHRRDGELAELAAQLKAAGG